MSEGSEFHQFLLLSCLSAPEEQTIAPPALSAAFCFFLRDGAMAKLPVGKSQAETRNGMKDLFATFGWCRPSEGFGVHPEIPIEVPWE